MRLTQRIGHWHRTKRQVKVTLRWYDLEPTDGFPAYHSEQELRYPLTMPDKDIILDLFRPDRQAPRTALEANEETIIRLGLGEHLTPADLNDPGTGSVGPVKIG